MTLIQDVESPYLTLEEQASKPATPAAGTRAIYFKTDNKFYVEDESGTETEIGGGSIGGSTGSTDNAILRANGTGGSTVQSSGVTIDDNGTVDIPTGQTYNINGSPHTHAGGTTSGYQPWAMAPGMGPCDDYSSTLSMAAVSGGNGGAVLCPIVIPFQMTFDSVVVRNMSTANARAAEWRLYEDPGSTTLTQVTNAAGTWSFTPSGSGARASQSGTVPIALNPGVYWICIRNTSATQTFEIGTKNTTQFANNMYMTKAIAALDTTLDVSSGWSKSNNVASVLLEGRVFGLSSLF